jgi:transposase-like protein
MPKGKTNARHTGEFKQAVIEDMRTNGLSQNEAAAKYEVVRSVIQRWERIYLEEGAAGLYEERRGRASKMDGNAKGRPPKLDKQVEKDLIAENQQLRMEIDYLKKLNALVLERHAQERKPRRFGN